MDNNKIYIIAEAGVNHNGKLSIAKKLIKMAKDSGADAVKFQTWKKGEITGVFTNNVNYIKKNFKTNLKRSEISNKLQLSYKNFIKLRDYAKKINITFLSTPDGFESLEFVTKVLKVPLLKIGSSELNHSEFIERAAKTKIPLLVSTGMSSFSEVKKAVTIIKKYQKNFTILHCTSEYPVKPSNVNILSLKYLKDLLKVNIGFSDHTLGNTASIMAVASGVRVIEKHITIDNKMEGPDHIMSLNPVNFKIFVEEVRLAEKMLGKYDKNPTKNELKNLKNIRRGVVASRNLKKNVILDESMIICKRPFLEIEPNDLKKLIGRRLKINLLKDQPIKWSYLSKKNVY